MARPRTTYTAEYKLAAVKMIIDQKLPVAEVARRLDVGENRLRTWRKAFAERGDAAFPGHGHPTPGRRGAAPPAGRERAAAGRAGSVEKSRRVLRQPADVTFRFIADHADVWPVAWMCDALEVSVSGYYAWATRPESATAARRRKLAAAIEGIHGEVRQRYGSPRMAAELNARGHTCSGNTVAGLMRERGIYAKSPRRFVRTTHSDHGRPVPENVLDRAFGADGPDCVWGADIAHIPTREGWLYLAVVEDLFSRMVVGWSLAETMESRLVVDALAMALARRRPAAGLLAHSDRGSQYASEHYQQALAAGGSCAA